MAAGRSDLIVSILLAVFANLEPTGVKSMIEKYVIIIY
jgi:hypothetical protein